MVIAALAVVLGLVVLAWSADRFVAGAAALARQLNIAPLLVGLTIVALGTSAPEMLISAVAAWQGSSGLALGNALGSNIVNFGLVLGIAALVLPLRLPPGLLRREFLVMMVVMGGTLVLLSNGHLSRVDGLLLLLGLLLFLGWLIHLGRRVGAEDAVVAASQAETPEPMATGRALFWLLTGLTLLLLSARVVVWGALEVAVGLGIDDLAIGLTVIALGTSLPELAAAIASVLRRQFALLLGNLVGSNIFNLLAVVGLAAVIQPLDVPAGLLVRDYPVMLLLAALFLLFALNRRGGRGHIDRLEGLALLTVYAGWLVWLGLDLSA